MTRQLNVVETFEQFVIDGKYQQMKQLEVLSKEVKNHLRERLSMRDDKRFLFPKHGMVAKFVSSQVRTTRHEGVIQDLLDYVRPELALPLLKLDERMLKDDDHLRTVMDCQHPQTFYVRPNFSKAGKHYTRVHEHLFGGQSIDEVVREIRMVDEEIKTFKKEYERVRDALVSHKLLKEKGKVDTVFGSISRIAHSPTWDIQAVLKKCGEEFLLHYGKVELEKLNEWILLGRIPRKVLTEHQTITDMQLKFVVMKVEAEEKMFKALDAKRTQINLAQAM